MLAESIHIGKGSRAVLVTLPFLKGAIIQLYDSTFIGDEVRTTTSAGTTKTAQILIDDFTD
jgi:hypothetical protein